MNILNRRSFIKWLHWLTTGAIVYFFFVEPDVPETGLEAAKTEGLSTHAGVGMLLGVLVIIWTGMYLRKGMLGKPGPKLKGAARTIHPYMHKGLHVALPIMMATGLAAGLSAPFAVLGFGIVPLNVPGVGGMNLHDFAEEVHEIAFDILMALVVFHTLFHVWRHMFLKDNALRLMVPKILHKYL